MNLKKRRGTICHLREELRYMTRNTLYRRENHFPTIQGQRIFHPFYSDQNGTDTKILQKKDSQDHLKYRNNHLLILTKVKYQFERN